MKFIIHATVLVTLMACSNGRTYDDKTLATIDLVVKIDKDFEPEFETKQEKLGKFTLTLDSTGAKKYLGDSLVEYNPYFWAYPGTTDTFRVHFQSGFENTEVKLWTDKDSIFQGTLTTDHILGLAKVIRIIKYRDQKELKIKIDNSETIVLIVNFDYDFITFNLIGRQMEVTFTNRNLIYM